MFNKQILEPNLMSFETRHAVYYNVTTRCFGATFIAVEKRYVLHILSVSLLLYSIAICMNHVVICSLPRPTISFHNIVIG
jgi:hypothetical protein